MGGVNAEHVLELAAVDDQDPVEALAPERADPALGVGVGVWRSDRRADDRHAFAAEDLVEAAADLAVAVVEEEAEGLLPVVEEHQQVPRLLCDPVTIRISRARDELDLAALERDEEEDIDARQPDGLDGEEITCEHRCRLLAQELPPTGAASFRCRRQPAADQDRANRTRGERDAESAKLTNDPPVTPGWVLARKPKHQPLHVGIDSWPPWPPMRVRPAARHQPLVPAQQRARTDREDRPCVSRESAT